MDELLSRLMPINSAFLSTKELYCSAKAINSVVHTGVKSPGWENRITHFPL